MFFGATEEVSEFVEASFERLKKERTRKKSRLES
jgi:hypothetical protein